MSATRNRNAQDVQKLPETQIIESSMLFLQSKKKKFFFGWGEHLEIHDTGFEVKQGVRRNKQWLPLLKPSARLC